AVVTIGDGTTWTSTSGRSRRAALRAAHSTAAADDGDPSTPATMLSWIAGIAMSSPVRLRFESDTDESPRWCADHTMPVAHWTGHRLRKGQRVVSARRIGHLGGWAVAWVGALSLGLGLGAPGVAHADTGPDSRATEADSEARAVDDGRSARGEVGTASVRRPQVTVGARVGGRVGGRIDTVADSLADPLRKSLDRARASTAPRLSPAAKPGAAEFEAEQVDRLQKMLRPR